MSKFMTYDYWVKNYQPIVNHFQQAKYADNGMAMLSYETYGEEVEYVKLQDEKHIWTEVDGDEGTYIVSGWHYVNRIQYYITIKPWDDEMIEVPTWCERQCDCIDEEIDGILKYSGDPNPDCPICEEGYIQIPIDTVEDLKAIYGNDVEILG